jgi:hypothetical protein
VSVQTRPTPSRAPSPSRPVAHAPVLFFGFIGALLALSGAQDIGAQGIGTEAPDRNVLYPVEYIEARLQAPELIIAGMDSARPLEGDRSSRVTLGGPAGEPPMEVRWKPVAAPGNGFNNEPRYELAAYRFQKLFLDEPEYVVPPVVLRAMALEEYRAIRSVPGPTIRGTQSVLFLLSYWLQELAVDTADPFLSGTFDLNPVYARYWGNLNLFTHLIRHRDANHGNILISMDPGNPRVFSVDNDVAFRSQVSAQGDRWSRLLVDRLPDRTVQRLREITVEDLHGALGVLAEFEIVDGYLYPVEPGENLEPGRGLRTTSDRVQFGLTEREIRDVYQRIERVLRDVDRGRITTFSHPAADPSASF